MRTRQRSQRQGCAQCRATGIAVQFERAADLLQAEPHAGDPDPSGYAGWPIATIGNRRRGAASLVREAMVDR